MAQRWISNGYGIDVGRCIYCGSNSGHLTKEHSVPKGLNGSFTLLNASCKQCQVVTAKLEDYVLGTMLKGVRQKQGYKSRKGHPAHITAKLEHGNGENFEKQIATDDYPTLLALPRYPVSPALKNSTGATKTTIDAWVFTSPNDVIDTFLNNTSATALNVGEIDYLKFARFLAKIGHCAAIAQYGINQLLPFTTGLILGDTRRAYLVGTNDNDTPATSTTRWQVRPRVHLATGIVVVDIRLFSDLGAPTYHVVAGMISHSQSNGCGAQRPPMFA